MRRAATTTILHVDNELVRVPEWQFADSAKTGRHTMPSTMWSSRSPTVG